MLRRRACVCEPSAASCHLVFLALTPHPRCSLLRSHFFNFQLSNEEWGVLFKLLSANGSSSSLTVSGYAAVKSFEAIAWLLHEPRLSAEVPLICVRCVGDVAIVMITVGSFSNTFI